MHPWYGLKFKQRKLLTHEMRLWLSKNEGKRLEHGFVREDGKLFCGYGVGYKNGEHWASHEVFEKRLQACRLNQRKRRKDPIYRAKFNEYIRTRYLKRADVREKNKKRSQVWDKQFPERRSIRASKRRALIKKVCHCDHDPNIELGLRKLADQLTKETGIRHHIDHIIPIAHGGMHHHQNLQILPEPVNLQKSSNPFWTSEIYLDFRSVPRTLWPEQLAHFFSAIAKC